MVYQANQPKRTGRKRPEALAGYGANGTCAPSCVICRSARQCNQSGFALRNSVQIQTLKTSGLPTWIGVDWTRHFRLLQLRATYLADPPLFPGPVHRQPLGLEQRHKLDIHLLVNNEDHFRIREVILTTSLVVIQITWFHHCLAIEKIVNYLL